MAKTVSWQDATADEIERMETNEVEFDGVNLICDGQDVFVTDIDTGDYVQMPLAVFDRMIEEYTKQRELK